MKVLISKIVAISVIALYSVVTADIQLKKGWTRPNAWQNDENTAIANTGFCECDCPSNEIRSSERNNDLVIMFYKKLLNMLFDRDTYSKDDVNNKLQRSILFELTENELKLIEKSTDPRDWDEFVTKVFQNAQATNIFQNPFPNPYFYDGAVSNIRIAFESLYSSYFEFNVFTISSGLIILILFLHVKHNYNLVALCLVAIFGIGYFNAYKECNTELAIEKLVNMLEPENDSICMGLDIKGSEIKIAKKPWYNFWSKPSKIEECADYLRKRSKMMDDRSYCTPDDVFLRYIYNSYMSQFEMLIHKTTEIFQKITTKIGFPWNFVACGIFCVLMTTFLTLFFKYVIKTFIERIPSLRNETQNQAIPEESQNQNNAHVAYLEMLRTQNDSINHLARAISSQPLNITSSGVQNLEAIESNTPVNILTTSSDQSVTLEDVPNDEDGSDNSRNTNTSNNSSISSANSSILRKNNVKEKSENKT